MSPDGLGDLLTAFSFRVEIWLPGGASPLCDAAFASCDGLEIRFDVHTLREGGSLGVQRLFSSPAAPGRVTLRRGMTSSFDLWEWCSAVARDRGPRAECRVVVIGADGETERARFVLRGCLPVRLRGPSLDASTGAVAIEELELACESLVLEPARPDPDAKEVVQEVVRERVELRELDPAFEREINPERWVQALVNPESIELAFTRDASGEGGPGSASLAVDLWLDVTADARPSSRQPPDVHQLSQAVAYFITPRSARGSRELRPPAVRLAWGAFTFDGHLESLRQSLGLFSPDGRPGRALLSITLSRPWITKAPPGA